MTRLSLRGLCQHVLLFAIAAHRCLVAPLLGASCRYVPSCSRYAEEAIRAHGPGRGARLAALRLLRCRPWGGFGHDPVPGPRREEPRTVLAGRELTR